MVHPIAIVFASILIGAVASSALAQGTSQRDIVHQEFSYLGPPGAPAGSFPTPVRPVADIVPTVWVALAVAAGLMLAPYVFLDEQRVAAVIVGFCAFVMAGIAWRIASAPRQLFGEDVRYERVRDRYSRTRKAGVTAVVAIGTIMVFMSFVNYNLATVLPLQRTLLSVSWWTWALSGVSLILYCTYLGRHAASTS